MASEIILISKTFEVTQIIMIIGINQNSSNHEEFGLVRNQCNWNLVMVTIMIMVMILNEMNT